VKGIDYYSWAVHAGNVVPVPAAVWLFGSGPAGSYRNIPAQESRVTLIAVSTETAASVAVSVSARSESGRLSPLPTPTTTVAHEDIERQVTGLTRSFSRSLY